MWLSLEVRPQSSGTPPVPSVVTRAVVSAPNAADEDVASSLTASVGSATSRGRRR